MTSQWVRKFDAWSVCMTLAKILTGTFVLTPRGSAQHFSVISDSCVSTTNAVTDTCWRRCWLRRCPACRSAPSSTALRGRLGHCVWLFAARRPSHPAGVFQVRRHLAVGHLWAADCQLLAPADAEQVRSAASAPEEWRAPVALAYHRSQAPGPKAPAGMLALFIMQQLDTRQKSGVWYAPMWS